MLMPPFPSREVLRLVSICFTFVVADTPQVCWFQAPLEGNVFSTDNDNYQVSIQFGSEKLPTFDTMGVCECFYRLRKTQLLLEGNDLMSMTYHRYCNDRFIQGYSFDKAAGEAVHPGTSTLQGGIVYLKKFRNCLFDATGVHIMCF